MILGYLILKFHLVFVPVSSNSLNYDTHQSGIIYPGKERIECIQSQL